MTLPSGTVTFLFSDIEGSTKLAREHPDAWEAARARHHAILRGAIESHKGYVFQIIGDAFCAAFHTAGDALRAAVKSQIDLCSEHWGDARIKVRMGIHTGKAEIQENGQYHGYLAMSRIQRLMSAGHGGQVLISAVTQELLLEDLPEEISLRDLGERRLKDLIRPEHIYQLVIPGLPVDFPALKTLDFYRHNLPTQMTSFIGREKEMDEIKQAISTHRLVTLTGSGGTGKTRLSLQIAADLLDQFPDGVWMVELAPILDPVLVAHTTAIAIGLRDEPQRPFIDMLYEYLREKKMLIILDNCEHLVDACAQMANKILQAAPTVRILASSREALGIAGEVTQRVPSLGLPDMGHLPHIESLSQCEAVKLFIDRATSAVPTFTVTNSNAPALAQICYRLDGIPLAIELAAAKVRVLSLEQIAKRLDDRLRLLTGGSRTVLEHHQTLRAAIDWSYNLLPPLEQTLFRRLAVFIDGWTLEAAEYVCSEETASDKTSFGENIRTEDILNLMEQLINKSLVITEEMQSETRYHMLETMRQYANEKLVESDVIRGKHAAYFLTLAETVEPYLEKTEQASWLDKLEREHNNLRAALRWAREKGQVQLGLQLASALCLFWFMRGYLSEGLEQIGEFLSLSERTVNATTRAKALDHAGMLARYQGDLSRAYELIAESLSLRRELGERHGVADSLSNLGFVVLHQGDFNQARQLYSEALSINRELNNQQGIADSLSHLALMAFYDGDYESAQTMDESSLAIWRGLGDQQGIAWALHRLGNVKLHQGEYTAARDLFRESLAISNDVRFKWGIAFATEGLASVAAGTGQAARAILLAAGASALRQAIGIPLSTVAQAEFERLLAPARKLLGEEAAETVWSKGLHLKIEQAVAEAQEVI
jgi:predicted ATPase/class 3 adenylate cyclase